jgi:hypothetical protein
MPMEMRYLAIGNGKIPKLSKKYTSWHYRC